MFNKIVYIVIFFSVSLLATEVDMKQDGSYYRGEIKKTYTIKDGVLLIMDDMVGDISVVGEARSDIFVNETFRIKTYSETSAQKILLREQAKIIHRKDCLMVEGNNKSNKYYSSFAIKLPLKYSLDIKSSESDVDLSTLNGDVLIDVSAGDIAIHNVKGDISLKVSGGNIELDNCYGKTNLESTEGNIGIDGLDGEIYASTSSGDIDIYNFNGDGEVKTSGGDIEIVGLKGDVFKAETSGGDIDMDDIDIHMVANTSGGNINIRSANDDIKVYTSGGSIYARKVKGNLAGISHGGNIEVKNVFGLCTLTSIGGDIEVGTAYNNLNVVTSGGDINISGVFGFLIGESTGGDIQARKLKSTKIKNDKISLKTSGGDISLTLPDEYNADIDAEINYSRKNAGWEIDSEFPLKISKTKKSNKFYLNGKTSINKGGTPVSLYVIEGDIRIKREFND